MKQHTNIDYRLSVGDNSHQRKEPPLAVSLLLVATKKYETRYVRSLVKRIRFYPAVTTNVRILWLFLIEIIIISF